MGALDWDQSIKVGCQNRRFRQFYMFDLLTPLRGMQPKIYVN